MYPATVNTFLLKVQLIFREDFKSRFYYFCYFFFAGFLLVFIKAELIFRAIFKLGFGRFLS